MFCQISTLGQVDATAFDYFSFDSYGFEMVCLLGIFMSIIMSRICNIVGGKNLKENPPFIVQKNILSGIVKDF